MGSITPLIDIDGREYTGFLEKKKAAENLEFTTFFRRMADEMMVSQATSGHNYKLDIEKFRRALGGEAPPGFYGSHDGATSFWNADGGDVGQAKRYPYF